MTTPFLESVKIQRTRLKIRQAFLALYAQKPISHISIKEVTYAARINRGTFYLHYFDLDDLAGAIENEHLEKLGHLMEKFPTLQYSADEPASLAHFFIPVLDYIATNGKEFKILLSPHSRPSFRQALQRNMHSNLVRRFERMLEKVGEKEPIQNEYVLEYIVSGNLGIIIRWIQSETVISVHEVTTLISNISLRGPFQLLAIE